MKIRMVGDESLLEEVRNNGMHCPCQMPATDDTICICKYFKDNKDCICGLYEVVEE